LGVDEGRMSQEVYSTQCTISMTELTNTKYYKDELILDYINY